MLYQGMDSVLFWLKEKANTVLVKIVLVASVFEKKRGKTVKTRSWAQNEAVAF